MTVPLVNNVVVVVVVVTLCTVEDSSRTRKANCYC